MNDFIQTTWIKPPHQIGGLDHLGVQAPCIQIYGDLLPGITNVTDRARYYSFYPWLLAQFEAKGWRTDDQLVTMLRKAECLLTLIALNHAHESGGASENHRAAMVGNDTLVGALDIILEGNTIRLSDYTHTENGRKNRYFKNPYGALAQYYFGTLRGLGLLRGDSPKTMRLPKETGSVLASIVARQVPGDLFIEMLIKDQINQNNLSELFLFCPCQLAQATEEVESLIGIMLHGWTELHPNGSQSIEEELASKVRSKSLAYLCILTEHAAEEKVNFDTLSFRGYSYCVHSKSGNRLKLPESLNTAIRHWQSYQRNEILSIALQGLFFAQLHSAYLYASELTYPPFSNTSELSHWFWQTSAGAIALQSWTTNTAGGVLLEISEGLPGFGDWTNDQHEIQCMDRVVRTTRGSEVNQDKLVDIVRDCLNILSAVIGRPENKLGYDEHIFPENYLDYYPVNLSSVMKNWNSNISNKETVKGFSLFTLTNCLDAHLRIAMRKLSQQGKNTFRFEPSELGLIIKNIPAAANTTPRFRQAKRILLDLGLLSSSNEDQLTHITPRGKEFVEAAL